MRLNRWLTGFVAASLLVGMVSCGQEAEPMTEPSPVGAEKNVNAAEGEKSSDEQHAAEIEATTLPAATQPAATQPGDGLGVDAEGKVNYVMDFEEVAVGELPAGTKALTGAFSVMQLAEGMGEGKAMMLPGEPLHTQNTGVTIGPQVGVDVVIEASFYTERTGRRYPRFGVGLGGANYYKARLVGASRELQLSKYDDVVATAKVQWKPGTWQRVKLALVKRSDTEWEVMAKTWAVGADEPDDWQAKWVDEEEPWDASGSVWATPFSGKAIYMDDVVVRSWLGE